MVVMGTSLGGAIAMDFALEYPQAVEKLVLVDAQGFIDGLGPWRVAPKFLINLLVQVNHFRHWSAFMYQFACAQSRMPNMRDVLVDLKSLSTFCDRSWQPLASRFPPCASCMHMPDL